ncbi:hypothetical protein VTN77DRAFT_5109 [Rasamsonia byssochlamydoides]|uniref:uncharacterized protein n=1 Tax=Rasamsonia byssochlamydoides TaxID=89139 RepID=UPI003743ED36
MSVTTTTTANVVTTRTTLSILTDYDLHHTGSDDDTPLSSTQVHCHQQQRQQPNTWPTNNYRRLPPHRPINRHLDFAQRPSGASLGESIFIEMMLHGVWLNATVSAIWRKTAGRLNDRIFRYEIGGEW